MRKPLDYAGSWKIVRYDWKKALGKSQNLSRSARHLGIYLCDTYANHKTGCCWPSNQILSDGLRASDRSIQRWLAELRDEGFLVDVRIARRRRAMQLVFPPKRKDDGQHVKSNSDGVTIQSPEHDNPVVPYNEPKKNLISGHGAMGQANATALKYIVVRRNEKFAKDAWSHWLSENIDTDCEKIWDFLCQDGNHLLPLRYPPDNDAEASTCRIFFRQVLATEGAMFKA